MKKIRIYLVPLVLAVVAVMLSGCPAPKKNNVSVERQLSNHPMEADQPGVITGED